MKKLLLILIVTTSFAQEHYLYASAAIDVRNAIVGTEPTNNNPEIDYFLQAGIVSRNIELTIGHEKFKAICFDKMTVGINYHFPLYGRIGNSVIKTIFIPGIEPTIINRWGDNWQTTSSHLSIAGNIAFRWNINDDIAFEILSNFLPRVDLKARYAEIHNTVPIVISNYFKIIYKFNR